MTSQWPVAAASNGLQSVVTPLDEVIKTELLKRTAAPLMRLYPTEACLHVRQREECAR